MKINNPNDVVVPEDSGRNKVFDKIRQAKRQGNIITAPVVKVIRKSDGEGGERFFWQVDLEGEIGIVPFAETDLDIQKQMNQFIGIEIPLLITKINEEKKIVLLSRKKAREQMKPSFFNNIKQGNIINGYIVGVGDNRVYVDIGFTTVKVNRSQATDSKATFSLRSLFTIGQPIKVKVTKMDYAKRTVEVSIRLAKPNPWETLTLEKKDCVVFKITKVPVLEGRERYLFGEYEHAEGVEAIINVHDHEIDLTEGERIQAEVRKIDKANRRLRADFRRKLA